MNARRVPLVMGPQWLQASPLVAKEFHAIAPFVFWSVVAMTLCGVFSSMPIHLVGVILPVACAALAAQAAGHDFSNRTLASLLAQPVSRSRVWCLRMLLVVGAAGTLGLLAPIFMLGRFSPFGGYGVAYPVAFILDPILNAICLAPLLTLLSRSVLFGTVFTVGLPFALSALIQFGCKMLGSDSEVQPFDFKRFVLIPMWTASALLAWRRFVTLEVIDGSGVKVVASARGAERGVKISSPAWQLLKKELMLQRLPMALSALGMAMTWGLNSDQTQLWTIVYPPMVVMLAGAVASADERSMGTLQWQTLLPIPIWKQWGIKVAVAYLVALGFGVVGPGAVVLLKAGKLHAFLASADGMEGIPWFFMMTLLVTAVTIYISSISESALRAMLVSLGTILVYFVGGSWAVGKYMEYIQEGVGSELSLDLEVTGSRWAISAAVFVIIAGFSALMFKFAMQNHRSADRAGSRTGRQCAWLIGFAASALCLMIVVVRFARIGP